MQKNFSLSWLRTISRGLLVLVLLVPALALASNPVDNDANAIMWGGAYDKSTFYQKLTNGDGHSSATNLQDIYYHQGRGITSGNFDTSVDGTVYKDGHIVVNGKTVATGARSVGRQNMTGSTLINGLYERPTGVSFASNSIAAFVDMDGGVFHYAILKSCGNPVSATPVKPAVTPQPTPKPTPKPSPVPSPVDLTAVCDKLVPSQPDRSNKPQLFRFTVHTGQLHGASIQGYEFSFDDGTDDVTTASNRNYVERTLSAGSQLTVHAQVQTSAGLTDIADGCSATVMVQPSPTATPKPTSQGQVLGVSLPDTGPEAALGGMVGVSAIGGMAYAYRRSKLNIIDALRRRRP